MAVLTVGYGKTYSNPFAAYTAAEAGDTIKVYSSIAQDVYSCYYGTFGTMSKNIAIIGMGQVGFFWSARQYIAANVSFENFDFKSTFNASEYGFCVQAAGALTVDRCVYHSFLANRPVFPYQNGAVANVYNSIFIGATSPTYSVWAFLGTTNVYNCAFVNSNAEANSGFRVSAGATANVANCVFAVGQTAIQYDGGTLNADYNAWTIAPTGGTLGAHNVVKTVAELGLVRASSGTTTAGWSFDYRTKYASEIAGTTSHNGADLTAIFTTDIDGRAREATAAGYAMGCSHGYRLYEAPSTTVPGAPEITSATAGSASVTLALSADEETDTIYARYRLLPDGGWSAESETLKRTGSGNLPITGLTNGSEYQFSAYAITGVCASDWSIPVSAAPTTGVTIMSAEEALRRRLLAAAGLTALVAARIYPQVSPQSAALPYLVYSRIDGDADHHMSAESGFSTARVQIDSYAASYGAVKTLANQVRLALNGYAGTVVSGTSTIDIGSIVMENDQDIAPLLADGEDVPRFYRVTQDFIVTHNQEVPTF